MPKYKDFSKPDFYTHAKVNQFPLLLTSLWDRYPLATYLYALAVMLCNEASFQPFRSSCIQTLWLQCICRCLISSATVLHSLVLHAHFLPGQGSEQSSGEQTPCHFFTCTATITDSSVRVQTSPGLPDCKIPNVWFLGDGSLKKLSPVAVWSTLRNTWRGEETTKTLAAAIS